VTVALTQEVAQQFSQGSLSLPTISLDLAITGNAFFATISREITSPLIFPLLAAGSI